MKLRKLTLGLALLSTLSFTVVSCGPKDDVVKTEIVSALSKPDVMVSVDKGVATISGKAVSTEDKAAIEAKVKAVKGVKSVVNNMEVPPPPTVDPDAANNTKIATALKDFPKVQAKMMNGIVVLNGEATKEENKKIMQAVSALNIAKIDNKLVIK